MCGDIQDDLWHASHNATCRSFDDVSHLQNILLQDFGQTSSILQLARFLLTRHHVCIACITTCPLASGDAGTGLLPSCAAT